MDSRVPVHLDLSLEEPFSPQSSSEGPSLGETVVGGVSDPKVSSHD